LTSLSPLTPSICFDLSSFFTEERDHLLSASQETEQAIQEREDRMQQLEEIYEEEKRSFLVENEGLQNRIDVSYIPLSFSLSLCLSRFLYADLLDLADPGV
jgi:hypothetical protein